MEIRITVIGQAASGKSAVLSEIKKALKASGLRVQHNPAPDFRSEQDFDAHMADNTSARLEAINEKGVVIVLEEQQARREA